MTDQFDVELRDRLARVASAVPVEPPSMIGAVTTTPVHAGSTTRRLALGGLLPILAVALAGTLLAGIAKVGPFAPGASAANGPVVATKRSGDFELTIGSAKQAYSIDEAIEIKASLAYLGQGIAVIGHAQGATVPGRGSVDGPDSGGTGGPIGFGIVEPVLGDLHISPNWAASCERSTLEPGLELFVPFEKSGAWSGDNPRSDEYRVFIEDPVLQLPQGTWHVYALAEFTVGDCGPDLIKMRVDIAIEVRDAPRPTNLLVPGTQAPVLTGPLATDIDGDFELTLRSDKSRYTPDEPIDITGSLTYRGGEDSVEFRHDSSGPIMFGIRERVFGEISVGTISILMWDRTTLQRSVPYTRAFEKDHATRLSQAFIG